MGSTAAATSPFLGTRLPDSLPAKSGGRFQARFGFGGKKKTAAKKSAKLPAPDRPLWFPGAKAPEWLDGSVVGDYGFDPFGLGKPAKYLQFDLDSPDQNLAKNQAAEVIGTRSETSDVKSTTLQPYTEVFGLQRFRECELIHGRWAMLATLGALAVVSLTGIPWQDAGKVTKCTEENDSEMWSSSSLRWDLLLLSPCDPSSPSSTSPSLSMSSSLSNIQARRLWMTCISKMNKGE
ncbi:chlorophyll a-b binding protein CP29.2, chloroplastic-like isoform X2 [Phoenix dactylifera]|uniref:Chlorophyll a-b binding protein, chloroplastic n=1 Tax=Phoenix dactylifera TaxID=42345 RepID=A0A8B9A7L7_PHODC|nr:chlorophyll a-b binding protein CP29.2, chloroplastic-like isoform X2 [Phoenix dactylifera]